MRREFKLRRKTRTIATVVPESVYNAAVKALEDMEYVSLSDYLRALLLEDLRRRGYLPQGGVAQSNAPQEAKG
jgi:Arc/MetJ-type ribon-helix-helix transcriptional regulator